MPCIVPRTARAMWRYSARMWQNQPPASHAPGPQASPWLEKLLPVMSIFTMVMTVPQVWSVWVEKNTSGVSMLSWGAYLLSAVLWLVHGLQKRDRTLWVPCIGWILLDAAVVVGVWVRG
jgi:uncharacterized protein with PQ loop repeat